MDNDIFKNYKFNTDNKKTVFDYLNEQKKMLWKATHGVLIMDVTISDTYESGKNGLCKQIYKLFIVCPRIGNYRKLYLTITETFDLATFPVDILINDYCDSNNNSIISVSEGDFLKIIEDILSRPSIKRSIESLYKQSLEN